MQGAKGMGVMYEVVSLVRLLYSLSSVTAVVNHLKTLDEYVWLRVFHVPFCAHPDDLPFKPLLTPGSIP